MHKNQFTTQKTSNTIRFGNKTYRTMGGVYRDLWSSLRNESEEDLKRKLIAFNNINATWNAVNVYDDASLNLYIFRMCYAYTALYREMFRKCADTLLHEGNKVRLHVLSIGCGCKSDALALKYVLDEPKYRNISAAYTGIDVVDWSGKQFYYNDKDSFTRIEAPYIQNEVRFIQNDLGKHEGNADVYAVVFPNMISELKAHDLELLLDALRKHYRGKKCYILTSRNPERPASDRIDDAQSETIRQKVYAHHGSLINGCVYSGNAEPKGYIWADRNYNGITGNVLTYCEKYEQQFPGLRKMVQTKRYIQYEVYKAG